MQQFLFRILSLGLLFSLAACPSSCPKSKEREIPPAGLAGVSDTNQPRNYEEMSDKQLADAKKDRPVIKGRVVETINVENFSYLRLQTEKGEEWIAILNSKAAVGDEMVIEEQVVLTDFHSKSLNRTFPRIIFGAPAAAGSK